MADNRLTEAVDIVAREVLWQQAAAAEWEDYADIGEHDWDAVFERAHELANRPTRDEHEAAFQFLKGRAGEA